MKERPEVYRPKPGDTLQDIAAVVLNAGYGSSDIADQTLVDNDGWMAALHLAARIGRPGSDPNQDAVRNQRTDRPV